MLKPKKVRERRRNDEFTVIERRKGKVWMHSQVGSCVALVVLLAWLVN
jgi:hypothetical protein